MDNLRSTYAQLADVTYRNRIAAGLLDISESQMRTYADEIGVERIKTGNAAAVRTYTVSNLFDIVARRRKDSGAQAMPKKPLVICSYVMKGGTGKTSTAGELTTIFQLMGYKVLAIDFDAQANLTQILGYESDLTRDGCEDLGLDPDTAIVEKTMVDVCDPFLNAKNKKGGHASPYPSFNELVKRPFGENGPHLIAADVNLGDLEYRLISLSGLRETVLHDFFEESSKGNIPSLNVSNYDIIIIDCPPSASLMSMNALVASDIWIAPIKMDAFSQKGLLKLFGEREAIIRDYKHLSRNPKVVILPTHFRDRVARIASIYAQLGPYEQMIANEINLSEDVPSSQQFYLPVAIKKPTSIVVRQYRALADLIIQRASQKSGV